VLVLFIVTTIGGIVHHVTDRQIPYTLGEFFDLAPYFFAGAALFLFRDRIPLRMGYAALAAAGFAVVLATSAVSTLAALPIAYLALWAGATLPEFLQKVGSHRDISYGVYIYAFPIQQFTRMLGGADYGLTLYTVICVIATFPLAYASWALVEHPAQRFRKAMDRFPIVRDEAGPGFRRRRRELAAA
jgi:peptidoglycan/LPS O-acetylase OafA/YrhL